MILLALHYEVELGHGIEMDRGVASVVARNPACLAAIVPR